MLVKTLLVHVEPYSSAHALMCSSSTAFYYCDYYTIRTILKYQIAWISRMRDTAQLGYDMYSHLLSLSFPLPPSLLRSF